MFLCRFQHPTQGARVGLIEHGVLYDVSARWPTMTAFLQWSAGQSNLHETLAHVVQMAERVGPAAVAQHAPNQQHVYFLKPIDDQEVWAAGVTYERSRIAREEESAGSGIYDRVYSAERPEIFFKATPSRTVGPYEQVAIRSDSFWNVPEPELALVINPAMQLIGYTIGNDMSSRDIEGANPLYLPQAKMYQRCCALGPVIALEGQLEEPRMLKIDLSIRRGGVAVFDGSVNTRKMVRSFHDLIGYLGRDNHFPEGVILLTGTGIVPPDDFSTEAGDTINITISGIGTLTNTVVRGGA